MSIPPIFSKKKSSLWDNNRVLTHIDLPYILKGHAQTERTIRVKQKGTIAELKASCTSAIIKDFKVVNSTAKLDELVVTFENSRAVSPATDEIMFLDNSDEIMSLDNTTIVHALSTLSTPMDTVPLGTIEEMRAAIRGLVEENVVRDKRLVFRHLIELERVRWFKQYGFAYSKINSNGIETFIDHKGKLVSYARNWGQFINYAVSQEIRGSKSAIYWNHLRGGSDSPYCFYSESVHFPSLAIIKNVMTSVTNEGDMDPYDVYYRELYGK